MQFLRIRAIWITFEPLILQPVKVGDNGDPYSPTPGQQIQWSKNDFPRKKKYKKKYKIQK